MQINAALLSRRLVTYFKMRRRKLLRFSESIHVAAVVALSSFERKISFLRLK